MTNSNIFTVSDTAINNVYSAEQEIASLKGVNKDNNVAANSAKMGAYGEVIAAIAQEKLVKGNLRTAVSKTLRSALLEQAGINEASVKRYIENSVGAVRLLKDHFSEIPTQYTPDAIVKDLETLEIDSENKLSKAVSGEGEKTKARKLAEKVVGKFTTVKNDSGKRVQTDKFRDGLTDEELDEFESIMRELKAARTAYRNSEAARAAEAEAAEENVAVDSTVAEFTEAA